MPKMGKNAKLYRNTGTWASPSWTVASDAKDVNSGDEWDIAQFDNRASPYKFQELALKGLTLAFNIPVDSMLTDFFLALMRAHDNGSTIELLAFSGPVTTAGNKGLRADWNVSAAPRVEPNGDLISYDMSCELAKTDNEPQVYGSFTKAVTTGSGFTDGDNVYWDSAAETVTSTESTNQPLGTAVGDSADGDTIMYVDLAADMV